MRHDASGAAPGGASPTSGSGPNGFVRWRRTARQTVTTMSAMSATVISIDGRIPRGPAPSMLARSKDREQHDDARHKSDDGSHGHQQGRPGPPQPGVKAPCGHAEPRGEEPTDEE